ncbi:hypothetical protein LTR70_008604 [Exophiala xenobiotica]|uniref:Uncharacterized protein n=1 Tax=Lithohypha guttulata TaxID=1690604 RepID=A0ABR0K0G5_9EURO|nr:hypothetical protein LTR24_008313 [Lithohypha guttulata]KAK5311745.1 hypothetical protein LTR70_008604 [Exophiala xenobiotica]
MDSRRDPPTTYFGGGDSYRPAYGSRRASPPRKTSPPPLSRTEHHRDGIQPGPRRERPSRSANTTPVESPRSPVVSNSGENATALGRPSDPRHWRKATFPTNGTSAIASAKGVASAPVNITPDQPSKAGQVENAVSLWLKENIRRAVLEDRLDHVNEELEGAKNEEEEYKVRFPDHRLMHEQLSSSYKKIEVKAQKLSVRIQESTAKENKLIASMNDQQRDFLAGAIPVAEGDAYTQATNMIPKIREMENKIRLQELELQSLRRLANEYNVEDQHTVLQRLDRQDQRLTTHEEKITGHSNKLEENRQSLHGYKETLNAHKQSISDLDLRLTSSEGSEDEQTTEGIAETRAKLKSHDFQFANLSSVFTSQRDHKDLSSALAGLKASSAQVQADILSAKTDVNDVKAGNTELKNEIKQLQTSAASMKDDLLQTIRLSTRSHSHSESGQAPPNPQDIQQIKEDVQQIQKEITSLAKNLAELKTKPSSPTDPDFAALRTKVEKLSSFEGHYEKFYEDTKSRLRMNEDKLSVHDGTLQQLRELQTILESWQSEAQKAQKAADANIADHYQAVVNLQGHLTSKLSNVEKQYNDFTKSVEATTKQHMASSSAAAKAQFDALKQELDSIKPLVYRNDNSIKALDTRWNAISTAHLHKSIINSLVPLGPLCEQIKEDHAKLLGRVNNVQDGNAHLQREIDTLRLESSRQAPTADAAFQSQLADLRVRIDSIANQRQDLPAGICEQLEKVQQEVHQIRSKAEQITALPQGNAALSELTDKVKQVQEEMIVLQSRPEGDPEGIRQLLEATKCLRGQTVACETKADHQQENLTVFEQRISATDQRIVEISNNIKDVRARTGQVARFQSVIATIQNQVKKLESQVSTDVSEKFRRIQEAVDEFQDTVNGLKHEPTINTAVNSNARIVDIRAVLQDFEKCFSALIYREDTFVKITNLASTVSEDFIKDFIEKEPGRVQVRNIWFRGNKDANRKKTNRHALIQLQTPDPHQVIKKVNGQRWKGREPSAIAVDDEAIETVLLNKSEAEQASPCSGTPHSLPAVPVTTSAAYNIDDQDDTITVDDSICTPQHRLPRYVDKARPFQSGNHPGRTKSNEHSSYNCYTLCARNEEESRGAWKKQ